MSRSLESQVQVIIPARMESQRFPGKPLHMIGDKTLLMWTYQQAKKGFDDVTVLTADEDIVMHCKYFGMKCHWMDVPAPNGSHRIAAYVAEHPDNFKSIIINWQVDEPLVDPSYVKAMTGIAQGISTLVVPIDNYRSELFEDYDVPKVVMSGSRCHWFSRAPMRGALAHCGVYAIGKHPLIWLAQRKFEVTPYAKAESLEQLQWIESGLFEVHAMQMPELPIAINTKSDAEQMAEMMKDN